MPAPAVELPGILPMSRRWSELPERGTLSALRLIRWIAVRLGRPVGRLCLHPITLYFLLTAAPARRSSRQYLRRVLERPPRWHEVYRHIYTFAATILDRVYLLAGDCDRFDVRVHHGDLITQQVASGQGCLLLGAHLGSFEVLRVLGVTGQHFPLKILMNVDHNSSITQFLAALNPDIARTVIPLRGPETLLKVQESLNAGYLVGALGDRVADSDKTVRCPFLGEETVFPAGPLLLAGLLHCPVILFFGLYRGGNRYDIYFEQLAEQVTIDRHRPETLEPWVRRYVERLEAYTRAGVYNWFNFYDYWDEHNQELP